MKKNGRTLGQDLTIIRRGIREFGHILPGQMTHVMVRSILVAGIPFLETYVAACILNELTGNRNQERLFLLCTLGTGALFLLAVWRNFEDCRIQVGYERLFASHEIGLTNKSYSLPYELLEQDSIRRLRDEVSGSISLSGAGMASLYWDMDVLWTNLLMAGIGIGVSGVLFGRMLLAGSAEAAGDTATMILCIGALVAIGSFLSCRMTGKRFDVAFSLFRKGARYARFGDYYHISYLPDEDAAMDARIYRQENLILSQCQSKCYEHMAAGAQREYNAVSRYDGVKLGCSVICGCIVYVLIGSKAMEGAIGCGSIILLYSAVTRMIDALARTAEIVTDLRNNNEHLLRYFRYMDLPEEREQTGAMRMSRDGRAEDVPPVGQQPARPIRGNRKRSPYHAGDGGQQPARPIPANCRKERDIVFQNVSFRYPESDAYVLKNVNLRLRAREKTVIVGENGSGKTTLIKLLCRLYRPTEGTILFGGRDIWDYPYEEYMAQFATVFQDFSLFAFSVVENVAGSREYDEEKVMDVLQKAGLWERVARYAKGIRQPLFHDFDEGGADISGGEAQKLAIARAIYKDAPVMVLDEPTAALDPYAEYEVYENFGKLTGGKTVLFVSHRLSSCRMCDRIVVIHRGEVVQCGTHEELLAEQCGKYRELWNAQAQYYK